MAKKFEGTNEEWDVLVMRAAAQAHAWGSVLQSSKWIAVQHARGNTVVQILDDAGNPSLWVLLKITHGVWVWMCPKGPLVPPTHAAEWRALISILQHEYHATMVRIEPPQWNDMLAGHVPFVIHKRKSVSPTHTLLTNISKPFVELQKTFHEKTRYNIRVAEKHGVTVERLHGAALSEQLHRILGLYTATGERHSIASLPPHELRALISQCDVWVARYAETIVATSFHVGFGDTYTYLHGASSYEYRAHMGPYALHAAAITYAQAHGYHMYDWWGVAPPHDLSHPLAGVTRFKLGWGGDMIEAAGTFDIAIDRLRFTLYTLGAKLAHRLRP